MTSDWGRVARNICRNHYEGTALPCACAAIAAALAAARDEGVEKAAQSVQEYWDDVRGRGEDFSVTTALEYVRAIKLGAKEAALTDMEKASIPWIE